MLIRIPGRSQVVVATLAVLIMLAATACSHTDDATHPMTASMALATPSLEELEAQMALVGVERLWSGKYLQGGHVHAAWVDGPDLLIEAVAPDSGNHELHAIDVTRRGEPKWVVDLGPFALKFPPQADDRYVVAILDQGGGMVVIDRRTGSRDRRVRIPLDVVPAGPAVSSDSTVYVASLADNRLHALSPATGQGGWHFRAPGTFVSGPLMTPRLPRRQVIVGTDGGEVISLPATGWSDVPPEGPAWTRQLLGRIGGPIAVAEWTEPTGVEVSLLAPCEDHGLYCLDAATGDSRWIYRSRAPFRSAPQAMGGKVFARNADKLHVLDLKTGAPLFGGAGDGAFLKPHELCQRALAADADRIYLDAGSSRVLRINAKNGDVLAHGPLDRFDLILPTGDANLLLGLGADGTIVAFR